MDEPTKMDIVWMINDGKVTQSQVFLFNSANHSEARLDWYNIPEGSYELYAGEAPTGPRFSIYLVDQVKSIEECTPKSLSPSKHLLKIKYLNPLREPLKIAFQQKEDLKSWVEALKKALELGRKHRKKLEKDHMSTIKSSGSNDHLDEPFYDASCAKNTFAFEVDVDSTAASLRNNVVGDGTVIVSNSHVTLLCRARNYVISWHYKHVRRFGYSASSFLLEGGHKSGAKGEGLFMFSNCPGHKIKECIKARTSALAASRNSNRYESDDSDSSDYTEEAMEKLYSVIEKVHKKLNPTEIASTQPDEVYANSSNSQSQNKEQVHSTPEMLPKPLVPPQKPPHKPTVLPKINIPQQNFSLSNAKMSEVLEALSLKTNDHNAENPGEYSALSFCTGSSRQPDSDLSSVTGNLYGEALCQQNGLQQCVVDEEYSQVDYNIKNNKKSKPSGKKK